MVCMESVFFFSFLHLFFSYWAKSSACGFHKFSQTREIDGINVLEPLQVHKCGNKMFSSERTYVKVNTCRKDMNKVGILESLHSKERKDWVG